MASARIQGPHLISVATDVRRGRHLVAYTRPSGMGSSPASAPRPPPGAIVFPADAQRECATLDRRSSCACSIARAFRSVRSGRSRARAVGERDVSLGKPNVAFDARADPMSWSFSALLTGDQQAAALLSQRLRRRGAAGRATPARPAVRALSYRRKRRCLPIHGAARCSSICGARAVSSVFTPPNEVDGALQGPTSVLTGTGIGSFESISIGGGGARLSSTPRWGCGGRHSRTATPCRRSPARRTRDLPYRIGAGAISVASDNDSGRCCTGSARGKALETPGVRSKRRQPRRPEALARAAPDSNSAAAPPLLTAGRRGTVLASGSSRRSCATPAAAVRRTGSLHLRLIRP